MLSSVCSRTGWCKAWTLLLLLLLLGSLSNCLAAAAATAQPSVASCPTDVVTIADAATAVVIDLQPGSSYMLGAGLYILSSTVTVPADSALCVTGRDTVSSAGVTRLLPPAASGQLHFLQYGGFLQLKSLQVEGRATDSSAASSGGGVVIRRSANGTEDDGQPATFAALTVTFKSIAPRAVANDDDAAASLTFVNSTFLDNINTYWCDSRFPGPEGFPVLEWNCSFTGPPGAAGFSTVSPAVFRGRTVFRNNTWGAVYVAAPVTIWFQGSLDVSGNTKSVEVNTSMAVPNARVHGPIYGAGISASAGARITFGGATTFKDNTGLGGCGISLNNATATFAATAPARFIGNSAPTNGCTTAESIPHGCNGMALMALGGSVVFHGPVLMSDNWARSGAGGAVFLWGSNLTFHNTATLRNNGILVGPKDWSEGGGAIYARASHITHKAAALYINNRAGRASRAGGGAVSINGDIESVGNPDCQSLYGARSSFFAAKLVTFVNNTANIGGALHVFFSDAVFAGDARFQGNMAFPDVSQPAEFRQAAEGGAIYTKVNSVLSFGAASWFTGNKAAAGGAIKLGLPPSHDPACQGAYADTLLFANGSSSCWRGNNARQTASGAGLDIDGNSTADFGHSQQHNFGDNKAGVAAEQWESDIWVGEGSFTCGGGRVRETGRYAITGDVCAVGCTGKSCACPAAEVFSASKCSCQKH